MPLSSANHTCKTESWYHSMKQEITCVVCLGLCCSWLQGYLLSNSLLLRDTSNKDVNSHIKLWSNTVIFSTGKSWRRYWSNLLLWLKTGFTCVQIERRAAYAEPNGKMCFWGNRFAKGSSRILGNECLTETTVILEGLKKQEVCNLIFRRKIFKIAREKN